MWGPSWGRGRGGQAPPGDSGLTQGPRGWSLRKVPGRQAVQQAPRSPCQLLSEEAPGGSPGASCPVPRAWGPARGVAPGVPESAARFSSCVSRHRPGWAPSLCPFCAGGLMPVSGDRGHRERSGAAGPCHGVAAGGGWMVTPAEGPPPSSPNSTPTSEPSGRAPTHTQGRAGFRGALRGALRGPGPVRSTVGLTRSHDPPRPLQSGEGVTNTAPKCRDIPGRDPKQGGALGGGNGGPGCRCSSAPCPSPLGLTPGCSLAGTWPELVLLAGDGGRGWNQATGPRGPWGPQTGQFQLNDGTGAQERSG